MLAGVCYNLLLVVLCVFAAETRCIPSSWALHWLLHPRCWASPCSSSSTDWQPLSGYSPTGSCWHRWVYGSMGSWVGGWEQQQHNLTLATHDSNTG